MSTKDLAWTENAAHIDGPGFEEFHRGLAKYNARHLNPSLPTPSWRDDLDEQAKIAVAEVEYVEAVRRCVAPLIGDVPDDVDGFVDWFEELKHSGPGQGDPLFPWLANEASREDILWFITQEVAGEAGFDDLLAITQVKMPTTAKLEMARNYWDEMGRGREKGMHGPMLERLASYLGIDAQPENVVAESLALGNAMLGLARHRRYTYQSVGALGVIEMTAPTRAGYVDAGLKRLGIPAKKRLYFTLHSVLDVKHSECWNREVLRSLVAEIPGSAQAIGEGAVLRLWHGWRSFERYRAHFAHLQRSEAA